MIRTIDLILFATFVGGFVLMICGVVMTNIAVQEMRGVLNRDRAPNDQLRWHDAIQKVAQNVIDSYRNAYPDGELQRELKKGYYVAAIGGVLGIGSALALKFVP